MKTILPLSESLIMKIAAGEVIERPVFAVKELLENAIDAKAESITITLEDSGLKKIVITDTGIGMSREDLEESVKPHTTSKLQDEDGLLMIHTMGFRGEALASIAAVSNVTIKTRRKEDISGSLITVDAGEFQSLEPIGVPPGTTVTVSNLFYPVPARKKFLKSKATEYRLILELVSQYSLAFPQIRFTLIHNGKLVFDFPKTTDSTQRIRDVLGESVFSHMIPLEFSDTYLSVSGFITTPQMTTKSTQKQSLFINNRLISDRLISLTLKDAYGNMLEQNAFPMAVLFLSLPYETVDVNVHPRKEQVSFYNNQMIYDGIKEAVQSTLEEKNITFHAIPWKKESTAPTSKTKITLSHAGKTLKDTARSWNVRQLSTMTKASEIAQLHDLFLVTETATGILIIDQHAAHERILYEAFKKEFLSQAAKKELFHLPDAIMYTVTPVQAATIKEYLPVLLDWGFDMEAFGPTAFALRAVPALFKDREYKTLLDEVIETIILEERIMSIDSLSNKMLTFLACRAAVKAGDALTIEQKRMIIETLEKTENNATCPHGRPTKIELGMSDLLKLFKRF